MSLPRSRGSSLTSSSLSLSLSSQTRPRLTPSRSGKRKSRILPNSHVPVEFLLGKEKNKGYFHEIPNVPKAQPSHYVVEEEGGEFYDRRGILSSTSSADNLSQSSLSYETSNNNNGLGKVTLTTDPILDEAMSRVERESTTNNSNYDKIVTSPFDPRYPSSSAPLAPPDFLRMVGQSSTLPYSFETQAEASLSNKLRLMHKQTGGGKASAETMEELSMMHESKGINAARLREARLKADAVAKEKGLEQSRLEKIKMQERIEKERREVQEQMRRAYNEKKERRVMLKQLSKSLKQQMGSRRKVSTGFAQCLRTSASSGMMLDQAIASPESTYGQTKPTEFDINDLIIGGDYDGGGGRFDVRGYDGNSLEEDGEEERSIDSGLQVSQDSLADYTASIHSSPHDASSIYSGLSPGEYNDDGVGFTVRRPSIKKMGSGFLFSSKKSKPPKLKKNHKGFQAILYNKESVVM
ncbi:hypothetical protein TrVE_jg3954 [Triparma verrucosa]|uniref:Uncharacterized protein n=1 Tax=Triparma verrucosa TaxID=1606542 RepID=A0A9W7EQP8_9STRA|nr:hypothetical protein TrVE_jg3954 [Triparma verrucosa]